MNTGWVKNILSHLLPSAPSSIGQGASAFEKKAKVKLANLIDVTDGVSLTEEARKRSLELLFKVKKSGAAQLDHIRLWLNVRRKVKRGLADFYDVPEIAEEVTEKIMEVVENDPFYRRLFR